MKILVVGAGAVGGYFGGRLSEAQRDVTFLVRAARAEHLRQKGLQLVSPHGDATIHPKLILAVDIKAPYDLILLSVKAYGLESAMKDFAPAVGPRTTILPMLNGMRHLDTLAARFGQHAVVGGVCRVSTEMDAAGRIVQLTDVQKLTYGEVNGGTSDRVRAVDQALHGAGFESILSENVLQDMWEKWVMLASLGAITCLFRGAIGEVQSALGGGELALKILAECAAIATASGYPPTEGSGGWAKRMIASPGSRLTSSMYRDMMAGGPVEADHILGDLIERGRAHGIETPLLQAAYVNLSVYQARLPG
ncbi:MAG: apbA [Acidobacteriaceae bacterium]|nr:apbA [Acidobacteriaceae bacterium]